MEMLRRGVVDIVGQTWAFRGGNGQNSEGTPMKPVGFKLDAELAVEALVLLSR